VFRLEVVRLEENPLVPVDRPGRHRVPPPENSVPTPVDPVQALRHGRRTSFSRTPPVYIARRIRPGQSVRP
jgi:hypothetical protein